MQAYLVSQDQAETSELKTAIRAKIREFPEDKKKAYIDKLNTKNSSVNGQQYGNNSSYSDKMMDLFCEVMGDKWFDMLTYNTWARRNGNPKSMTIQEVNNFIEDQLLSMYQKDPEQYRVFVRAIEDLKVEEKVGDVTKSPQCINVETGALKELQTNVNKFNMNKDDKLDVQDLRVAKDYAKQGMNEDKGMDR